MNNDFNYDGVLKDMFQEDRPVLLDELTGGLAVTEFLNVELPKVLERRLDLVMRLADGSILHVELQAKNDRHIAYREGVYCFLLARMYPGCRIRQVVLYVGSERLRMPAGVDLGETKGAFRLLDIREIDAGRLLASSNPADCALAILAGGGDQRIGEIVGRLVRLQGAERERALAQLFVLSGLRGLPGKIEWEIEHMSVAIDITKNPWLLRSYQKGRTEILAEMLEGKFGPLPQWASDRLEQATPAQVTRWARKAFTADTLEGVLGKKSTPR